MKNYLDLTDDSVLEGTAAEDLEEVLINIDNDRRYMVIEPEDLRFLVLDPKYTPFDYKGVVVPASSETPDTKTFTRLTVPEEILKLPYDLRKESVDVGVYFINPDNALFPMSVEAINDLQVRLGVNGRGTDYKSPLLMELLCEIAKNSYAKVYQDPVTGLFKAIPDGNSQREAKFSKRKKENPIRQFGMTVVLLQDHEDNNIEKVFSFRSAKYVPIEQKNVLEVLHEMQMMGKHRINHWFVSHFMTSVDVCFDDVAEEFTERFSLSEKVIPCFRVNTSDTGRSSLRISKYLVLERTGTEVALRLPECEQERKYELTRHFGKTDIKELVAKINKNLFYTFKAVPEKLGQLVFLGDAPTKDALSIAFKAMKLQKHAGVIISQDLEEKIVKDLAAKLPPVQRVYDSVYSALFAADDPDLDLSDNQKEELRNSALLAVFPTEEYKNIEIKTAVPAAV